MPHTVAPFDRLRMLRLYLSSLNSYGLILLGREVVSLDHLAVPVSQLSTFNTLGG